MEISQIRQQLSQVDQVVTRAARALKEDQAAPQELKDYVQQLSTQTRQAQSKLKQPQDEAALAQCIDDLATTGGRANQACESAGNLGEPAKNAVKQAYQQVSALKHQLH